jgi:hypothetical protein
MDDSLIIGCVLLAVVPLIVWDGTSAMRAGFDNAFWAKPLPDKLGQVAARRRQWNRLAIVWIPATLLVTAGLTAFAFQLTAAGEGVWAGLGLGALIPIAAIFVLTALLIATTVGHAAEASTSEVPAWVGPVWLASWWVERSLVIAANVAYVALGVGIVSSGYPAEWAGWVAIVSGALLALWASLRDYLFQHLILITPLALGVALILD